MEDNLLNQFEQILDSKRVTGCVLADSNGLCLLASPEVTTESAGLVSAIAQYASMIDNDGLEPIICLEGSSRRCLIKNEDGITTAIFINGHN